GWGGVAGREVVVEIGEAEVLADDLARRVALDAPGARIPRRDDAVDVELEDRIVDHGVHQAAKPAFGLQDMPAGLLALGDVAGDFGEADELAVLPHGVEHGLGPEAAAGLAPPPAFR